MQAHFFSHICLGNIGVKEKKKDNQEYSLLDNLQHIIYFTWILHFYISNLKRKYW